jgi:hypothetical protein
LTHVLVEQHPDQEGERVPAQQFVGGVVLPDAELRHPGSVLRGNAGTTP